MKRNNKSFVKADDLDATIHSVRGGGVLASKKDLNMSPDSFAEGCKMLLFAAKGDTSAVATILSQGKVTVDFRDYDRRTAIHVAASEGDEAMVKFLCERGAKINRSDRWGGSPLDDALRHRHKKLATYLRSKGAVTGHADKSTNLITAASEGDIEEVNMLIEDKVDINCADYDKRTAMHLAAGEGQYLCLKALLDGGGNPNAEDRFGNRPLDDAQRNTHTDCISILIKFEGTNGTAKRNEGATIDDSGHDLSKLNVQVDTMKVDWTEVEMIEKIGAGEFGEIFKCKWRGNLVAAKCVKSAKIRKEWHKNQKDDELNESLSTTAKDVALNDFRIETSILRQLRHPNICMLLGYSNTKDYEVMISELMKCSLLDVFKAHRIQGTQLSKKKQLRYAIELAKGMNYLHTCRPPILHRDLKPANLLVDFKDTLKITDFGLAKLRPNKDVGETDTFTMTGETGSYRFMAPEVFRHETYNEKVDVYSFAMIFYNLMAGHAPWPNKNGVKAVTCAAIDGTRPVVPRHWDAELSQLIEDSWGEDPNTRPSFSQILKILEDNHQKAFNMSVDDKTSSDGLILGGGGCQCAIS
mmetsp:Transcript_28294/g.53556  ORF Transcript_28294/g.53556 Transcript_28294/m.53556 type:complete len:582 (-) Transcript_28294:39-1784(-)